MKRLFSTARALALVVAASFVAWAAAAQGPAKRKTPSRPLPTTKKTRSLAIVGGTLWRAGEPKLANSVIVIREGKIQYVGTDRSKANGAKLLSARGKLVTAGFIDLLTRVGVLEVSQEPRTQDDRQNTDDPIRAAFRTADGYNPASSVVNITRTGGITSVGVVPTGGLVTGQSAWADLDGSFADGGLVRHSLALHVRLQDRWLGRWKKSRGTAMLRLRELLDDSQSYRTARQRYDRNQLRQLGASRLDYETVVKALDGKLPVIVHVDRASDIRNVLRLAKKYKLRLVLASVAEAWKVAPAIAAAKVPVIIYPLEEGPRTFSALGAREDNGVRLTKAGVSVALASGEIHNARALRSRVGNAIRAGLSRDLALAAVTEVPARIMGLDDRYGAIKPGKVANIVIWSDDPFELSSKVESLLIRGRPVSLRSRQTALFERYRTLSHDAVKRP